MAAETIVCPVTRPSRKRELGRGERVIPGVWRLRLPLPFPGIPHCNAWALQAGDGFVLVDTGMHEPEAAEHLDLAMSRPACGSRTCASWCARTRIPTSRPWRR